MDNCIGDTTKNRGQQQVNNNKERLPIHLTMYNLRPTSPHAPPTSLASRLFSHQSHFATTQAMDVSECDTVGRSRRIDGHLQDPVRDLIFVYESNLKSMLSKRL